MVYSSKVSFFDSSYSHTVSIICNSQLCFIQKNSTGSLSLIDPLPFPFLDGKKVKKSACTLDKGFGRQQKKCVFLLGTRDVL